VSVIWVLESPEDGRQSLVSLLQGDAAVRVFASIKNFLRLARSSRVLPDAIVVRCEDFADDLSNLDQILSLHWSKALRVYCHSAKQPFSSDSAVFYPADRLPELPFYLQTALAGDCVTLETLLTFGDICLNGDTISLRILPDGEWTKIAPKEAQILRHLIRFQERYLSLDDICAEVWKDAKISSRSVSGHMSRLRRHLQGSRCEIESLYGGGYRITHQLGS
jgi:hypothetical protein